MTGFCTERNIQNKYLSTDNSIINPFVPNARFS